MEKSPDNPMPRGKLRNGNPGGDLRTVARCGAKTRAGTPCEQPAVRGKSRCRLHGGSSTGPTTSAGLARMRASKVKHGLRTKEMQELRRMIRWLETIAEEL
jgi:hypothetical protein